MSAGRVIAANAPYWGAEAEICRTYFRSPARTAATDAAWIARQAAKELLDGVAPRLRRLDDVLAGGGADAVSIAELAGELHQEAAHFAAFVDAHRRIRPDGEPDLDRAALDAAVAWPGNLALGELRAEHIRSDSRLGTIAASVTEGGCCALFREGVALAGGSAADDLIAEVCAAVLADEAAHMLAGLESVDDDELSDEQWRIVEEMSVTQSRARLVMRDEQFGGAVGPDRLAELLAAGANPLLPG